MTDLDRLAWAAVKAWNETADSVSAGSWAELDAHQRKVARAQARAMLVAMREPSPAQVEAAYEFRELGADLCDFAAHDCAPGVWRAMIDALLADA